MKLRVFVRGQHPLSPWHTFNTRDKNHRTVVAGTMKEQRIVTLGHSKPSVVKANFPLQVRHLTCFITEKDKTLPLPKFIFFSFPEFTLSMIILFTLTYEVRLFPKLQPFSIRND